LKDEAALASPITFQPSANIFVGYEVDNKHGPMLTRQEKESSASEGDVF
jgi:hypothetical protein